MLVVPITGKIGWKNPPIVTILLIIINCFVYFAFQLDDDRNYLTAHEHYYRSGLADIEVAAYIAYKTSESVAADQLQANFDRDELTQYYREMAKDTDFQQQLDAGRIITPADPVYRKWKELAAENQKLLEAVTSFHFGFRPSHASLVAAFTYMFLHGGFGHLFGNMIFLWLVGCMLEMGCGRLFCLATYLITGLFSVLLFWVVYISSDLPLVGASGAIAGFMGAFATVYGRTKIKVFYSLGFYFNYIRFPAIALFPIWIGNEFFQLFTVEQSNVAYVAHIGGLSSGALLGFLDKKYFKWYDPEAFAEEPEDEISPLLEKALQSIEKLEMEQARSYLTQILSKDPNNQVALTHQYNIEKLAPQSLSFHQAAAQLLQFYSSRRETYQQAFNLYQDYISLAKKPKLSPDIYIRLGSAFSGIGKADLAGKIFQMLLQKRPSQPGLPEGLLKLAAAEKNRGNLALWKKYLSLVYKNYPDTTEARIAKQTLLAEK